MEFILVGVIVALTVGFVVWIVRYAKKQREKLIESWMAYASESGLTYDPGQIGFLSSFQPRMHGEMSGRQVNIYVDVRQQGKHTVSYTCFDVHTRDTSFNMRIYKKSILSGLGKALGMQDIVVGGSVDDQPFNDRFIIKGDDQDRVERVLNRECRDALMALKDVDFRIEKGQIHFERMNYIFDHSMLNELLSVMMTLAWSIEEPG